jgi:hypothetical protein
MIPLLEHYKLWDTGKSDDAEVEKRRKMLMATGLVREGAKAINGGVEIRVKAVFEKKDGLTMQQITDAINEVLDEEGKNETIRLSQVRSSLNFQCCDHLDRKTEKTVDGWLRREGDGDEATFHRKETVTKAKDKKKSNEKATA